MPNAEVFGLKPDRLPPEVEEFIERLEEHDPRGSFRTEALHYQEEACSLTLETRNSFVAHVIGALRMRFRETLQEMEE